MHRVETLLANGHSIAWLSGANPGQRRVLLRICLGSREHESRATVGVAELVGKLAHVVPDLFNLVELALPLGHAVRGLLLLEALQNGLVFHCDFHQFFLALHAIQTGLLDTHGIVEIRLGRLHDVGHFFEQNAILALDFRITA